MPDLDQDIRNFHERFGLAYEGRPRSLPQEMTDFRMKFMQEELDEYYAASELGDVAGMYDALLDLVYVAVGTLYLHGLPLGGGWSAVHACNMQKVRARHVDDSKRGSTYDVVKPPGWVGPDGAHAQVIDELHRAWDDIE